jgi:hypothetical protein
VPVTVGVMSESSFLRSKQVGLLVALTVGVTLLAAPAGSAQVVPKKLTIYSVAVAAEFLNHQDDRERAVNRNPFLTDTAKLAPNEKGIGPFAGDSTLYGFDLYTTAAKKKKVGTAVYTCFYNFFKQALCSATFELNGGTLFATGAVNFRSPTFKLAITGGLGAKYLGANGQVAMAPVALKKNTQRLQFTLVG